MPYEFDTFTDEELANSKLKEIKPLAPTGPLDTFTDEELANSRLKGTPAPTPTKPAPTPVKPIPESKDKDPRIEQYQKYMETSPLGIVYNNPKKEYGVLDQELIAALSSLEARLVELTGNYAVRGRLVFGNQINYNTTPQQLKIFIDKINKDKVTKTGSKVVEFKKFLKSLNVYSGDVESDVADPQFISALQAIEKQIAKAISNDSVIGLIWQGNGINPQTSPEDIQNALNIIKKKKASRIDVLKRYSRIDILKRSQSLDIDILKRYLQSSDFNVLKTSQSLDTFDVDQSQSPIATKTVPTADDMNIDSADPAQSQQIGKSVDKLPKKQPTTLELLKMLNK